MREKILLFAGALAGGVLGYFLFFWILRQGFYGIILPGCLLGFGAGLFPNRSPGACVVCGVLALALGLFTEWRFAPFKQDSSGLFFISHFYELKPITLIMIAAGGFIGFYGPFRHRTNPGQKL
jgi:hypothetical protein